VLVEARLALHATDLHTLSVRKAKANGCAEKWNLSVVSYTTKFAAK
jgi:hypothetical protein